MAHNPKLFFFAYFSSSTYFLEYFTKANAYPFLTKNLDKLSSNKLVIHPIENFTDSGPDSVFSVMENGCGAGLPEFIQAYYTFPEIISERNIDYLSLDSQIINLDR